MKSLQVLCIKNVAYYLPVVILLVCLSSCSIIRETMDALEQNRQAIDESTATIQQNQRTIQEANLAIEENRRQLEQINQVLKEASK